MLGGCLLAEPGLLDGRIDTCKTFPAVENGVQIENKTLITVLSNDKCDRKHETFSVNVTVGKWIRLMRTPSNKHPMLINVINGELH